MTTYVYDRDARPATLQRPSGSILSMSYDAAARLTGETFGSGFARTRSYDPANQTIGISEAGAAGTIGQWTFSYDPVGNRTVLADLPGNLTTYGMDAKNRLVPDTTTGPNTHTYAYSYDSRDNRLTSNESGALTTWSYDAASRMTTAVAGTALTTYGFDLNGNLTSVNEAAGPTTMSYDKENRLVVHLNGGTVATYAYSGDGLKRIELVRGVLTTLIWDGQDYYGSL